MQVYAKEGPGRWVVFEKADDGTLARLYSTTSAPRDYSTGARLPRIPWPDTYAGNGSIADRIKITEAE